MKGGEGIDWKAALGKLPRERLAAFVAELTSVEGVAPRVESLLTEGDAGQATVMVQRRIAGIRRREKPVWGFKAASELADELDRILDDIERSVLPGAPGVALDLVAAFIEADDDIFAHADDSYGAIGMTFKRACSLFGKAARRCPAASVLAVLLRLWGGGGYGARGDLMRETAPALKSDARRELIAELRRRMHAAGEREHFSICTGLMDVADVIGDPELYEEACLNGPLAKVAVYRLNVAQRYLKAGRPDEAMKHLPATSGECGGYANDWVETHTHLLRALGRTDEWRAALWREFRGHPDKASLDELLEAFPESERPMLIESAREEVLRGKHDPATQAEFFLDLGDAALAARCVLERVASLNGSLYMVLLPLAKRLEAKHPLAASALYRALLEGNLRQALSKYYHHGVRYWRALEELARRITDWEPLPNHDGYVAEIRQQHGRKPAFWKQLGKLPGS